jgi:hypothetical protein
MRGALSREKQSQKTGDISHPLYVQVSILLLNCEKENMRIKFYVGNLGTVTQSGTRSDLSSFSHCLPKTLAPTSYLTWRTDILINISIGIQIVLLRGLFSVIGSRVTFVSQCLSVRQQSHK